MSRRLLITLINMKKTFLSLLLLVAPAAMAQTNNGGISAEMLNKIKAQQTQTVADRALSNALAG